MRSEILKLSCELLTVSFLEHDKALEGIGTSCQLRVGPD